MKLNHTYTTIRKLKWLNVFVILTRYLIGFAFIPSGLKKVLGQRFTSISVDTQIGFFFEALYRSGIYWNFLGWCQLIAALLLMTQRFATVGALIFFGIAINIWLITISMHFTGTWIITSLLVLATLLLLIWDLPKLMPLFYPDNYQAGKKPEEVFPTFNRLTMIIGLLLFVASLAFSLSFHF
ncbi:MAG: hypothetical protein ABW174_11700 [Flavitalea sp.]